MRAVDIARLAGVSSATVSRVLNDSATVGPETRERVLSIVSRFDYHPNLLARNLRHGRAEMVGVLVSDIGNPHFGSMVRSIEDALYLRGKRVLLCNTSEDAGKQDAYLEIMAAERVLGVLISPSDRAGTGIGRLLDLGIPVVSFDRTVADTRADTITPANSKAAAQATQLLLGLGHRRIGFISGQPQVETGDERLAGYQATMRDAGLAPCDECGHFTVEGGAEAAESLLGSYPDMTALVVGNNQMTLGALDTLRRRGIPVPDGLALVAFDEPASIPL